MTEEDLLIFLKDTLVALIYNDVTMLLSVVFTITKKFQFVVILRNKLQIQRGYERNSICRGKSYEKMTFFDWISDCFKDI